MTGHSGSPRLRYCMIGFLNYFGDGRVRGYASVLRKAGCAVDVLGLHGLGSGRCVDESGVRLFSIPVSWTRSSRGRYVLEYGLALLVLGLLLTKLHLQNRYHVIHVHNMPDFLVFCALVPKLLGAKLILDIHDPMPEVYLSKFPGRENSLGMRLIRWQERLSTTFADTIITANPHFKRFLVARGIPEAKVTTINNYPDPEIFSASKRQAYGEKTGNRFTLIFPGTIAPRYGLEVAVRAMPCLRERIPNVHLLIIGRQEQHARFLKTLAARLGVEQCVEIRPSIPIAEVPRQLARADVGIYPALPGPHMSVAIPGKMLEFAIMGIPIVSSRLTIVEELFDQSAVLFFEPGNSDQFAECVIRLYQNPLLREQLVQRAEQIMAERQSSRHEMRAFWTLLKALLPAAIRSLDIDEGGPG